MYLTYAHMYATVCVNMHVRVCVYLCMCLCVGLPVSECFCVPAWEVTQRFLAQGRGTVYVYSAQGTGVIKGQVWGSGRASLGPWTFRSCRLLALSRLLESQEGLW